MNYLRLMQLTNTACGLQGDIDTVNNLKDIQENIAEFVKLANYDIQIRTDEWKFMQNTLSASITQANSTISNTDVAKWKALYYNGKLMRFYDYEDYIVQDWVSAPGVPSKYTIVPETNQVIVNSVDQPYNVMARYVRVPKDLVLDGDIPLIPERFHNVIVYKAASDFGSWLGNPEIEDKNTVKYDTLLLHLQRSEIPSKTANSVPMA